MLRAERDDELLVGLLLARLVEDAHVGLATVEGLGGLAETAGEPVVDQGELEDALEGLEDGHLALGRGIGGYLDLLGGDDGLVVFSVRLGAISGGGGLKVSGGERYHVGGCVVGFPRRWELGGGVGGKGCANVRAIFWVSARDG